MYNHIYIINYNHIYTNIIIYMYIYIYISHAYVITYVIYTVRMGVLPREVRFECARPVFYEIRDVVHLPRWMTRYVSKAGNPKP